MLIILLVLLELTGPGMLKIMLIFVIRAAEKCP